MNDNLAPKKSASEYSATLKKLLEKPTNPKLGLERMTWLLHTIGFDHSPRIIQVVGTNGKGSTVAFIESILIAHGQRVGLFSSPHLTTARERIRINGALVSKSDFVNAAKAVLLLAHRPSDEPSFFELMLAMALWLFKKHGVDFIILEAGLGGRLDATTATKPDILGISMIDWDHQNILGDSIEKITHEKVSAARPQQVVVSVLQSRKVQAVLDNEAKARAFKLVLAKPCSLPLGLYGEHQRFNAGLALTLLSELSIPLDPVKTTMGLQNVNWPGRFEIITHNGVLMVFDGAHNPSGITALVASLHEHSQFKNKPLIMVYGSLSGPNAQQKVAILTGAGLDIRGYFLHAPHNPRAQAPAELAALFKAFGVSPGLIYESWDYSAVENLAKRESAAVIVCGSLYTVGQVRGELLSIEKDDEMPNF